MNNIKKTADAHSAAGITPARVRVAAYIRVGSGSQELNAQVDAYAKLISAHDGWELVDIYDDEGPAGEDASCQKEFSRMLQDCRDEKIDRILVRSAFLFSRSAQECIPRELLQMGVTVYFEKEDLDTGDEKFEQAGTVWDTFSELGRAEHLQNSGSDRSFVMTV